MKFKTTFATILLAGTGFAAPINVYVVDDGSHMVDAFAYAWGIGGSISSGFDGLPFWLIKKDNHTLKIQAGSTTALFDTSEISLVSKVIDFGGRPLINQLDLEKVFGVRTFEAKILPYQKSILVSLPTSGMSVTSSAPKTTESPVNVATTPTANPSVASNPPKTTESPVNVPTTPAANPSIESKAPPKVQFLKLNRSFNFAPFRQAANSFTYFESIVSDSSQLMDFCEMVIKSTLKAPATAIFTRPTNIAVYTDGVYAYFGKVDAQNSYGALLRNGATCIIQVEGQNMLVYTLVN